MASSTSRTVLSVLMLVAVGDAARADVSAQRAGTMSATERPFTAQTTNTPQPVVTFGLCGAPQNADDFPSNPVAIAEDSCHYYQAFEATSVQPSYGSSCGGFTLAFGPMGDLKTNWKRHTLKAKWGDTPLTQAQCTGATLSAVAWGARCLNETCTQTEWEKIDTPLSEKGVWSVNSSRCVLEHQFIDIEHHYKTLNIDVIASLKQGSQDVRKRAWASIRAEKGNGKCLSGSATARDTPVQAASQAGATYQPQTRP